MLSVLGERHAADEVVGIQIRRQRLVVQRIGLIEDDHLRALGGQRQPLADRWLRGR